VQKRNNYIISMASRILNEVKKADLVLNPTKNKDNGLLKVICKFYSEYVTQFEKNLQKGDSTFPTMPLRFNMYKTLSIFNSNDKAVEKRYRNVGLIHADPHGPATLDRL